MFLGVLELIRQRYIFAIAGYVVMPEHFHLLMSEPEQGNPSIVMKALKQTVARRVLSERPAPLHGLASEQHFWQKRFYDFNVWSGRKRIEKLRYMHRYPVARGLAESPEQWLWSSFRAYAYGESGIVQVQAVVDGMAMPTQQEALSGPGQAAMERTSSAQIVRERVGARSGMSSSE